MLRGKELAQAVLDLVTKYPEKHKQSSWVTGGTAEDYFNPKINECGTRACLAGWTVLLNTPDGFVYAEQARAAIADELGIDFAYQGWEYVALKLLFPDLDVREFGDDFGGDDSPARRVQRAFYQTWDDNDAIEQFAAAFGLEVPEHE
jgi:hypothetical protein